MMEHADSDDKHEGQDHDPHVGKRLLLTYALTCIALVVLAICVYNMPQGRIGFTLFVFGASIGLIIVEGRRLHQKATTDPGGAENLSDRDFLTLVLPAMVLAASVGLLALDVLEPEHAHTPGEVLPSIEETAPPT